MAIFMSFPLALTWALTQVMPLLARLVRALDDSWDARSVKHEWEVLAEKDQTTGGFA